MNARPLNRPCRYRKAHHLALRPPQLRNESVEQRSQHQDSSQHPRTQRPRPYREIHPVDSLKQAAIDSMLPL